MWTSRSDRFEISCAGFDLNQGATRSMTLMVTRLIKSMAGDREPETATTEPK